MQFIYKCYSSLHFVPKLAILTLATGDTEVILDSLVLMPTWFLDYSTNPCYIDTVWEIVAIGIVKQVNVFTVGGFCDLKAVRTGVSFRIQTPKFKITFLGKLSASKFWCSDTKPLSLTIIIFYRQWGLKGSC